MTKNSNGKVKMIAGVEKVNLQRVVLKFSSFV